MPLHVHVVLTTVVASSESDDENEYHEEDRSIILEVEQRGRIIKQMRSRRPQTLVRCTGCGCVLHQVIVDLHVDGQHQTRKIPVDYAYSFPDRMNTLVKQSRQVSSRGESIDADR